MGEPETTTIQVSIETWAKLDRLKHRGDSFDDVIDRLLSIAPTAARQIASGEAIAPGEERSWAHTERAAPGEACEMADPITGEVCGGDAVVRETHRYTEGLEFTFAFCGEHRSEGEVHHGFKDEGWLGE